MTAYYNEFDPFAAAWLRELISAGHIAPGDVDTRSIVDVRPDDLRGYTQCHFFAGIGVWSYALRLAGWPDDRPVWTMSCPCQPFSAAGKGGGFDDERHLWPHAYWLICQRRPRVVLGEQVASKDGLAWLDLVQADMEGTSYAFGAVDTCAAGFGAPHIRQRLYWVGERLADTNGRECDRFAKLQGIERDWLHPGWQKGSGEPWPRIYDGELADPAEQGWEPRGRSADAGDGRGASRIEPGRLRDAGGLGHSGKSGFPEQRSVGGIPSTAGGTPAREAFERTGASISGMADNHDHGCEAHLQRGRGDAICGERELRRTLDRPLRGGADDRPSPTNGFWRDADWLHCRDGKWRPVEPGTFPLAHGAPARVGRLRGYGNAINAEQAQGFIEAYLETKAVDVQHFRLTELSDLTTDNDIQEDIFS